jgi:hypothetical protein
MTERRDAERVLCWEIGIIQQPKNGESICGDTTAVSWDHDDVQIVLSDGLGSGIQASIASSLTSALVSAMSRSLFSVESMFRTLEAVLPVTKKHGLAYATFTLAATDGSRVRLIQYDNPPALFLRDGVSLHYPYETLTIGDKTILESSLSMKPGDMLVLFSDGISEAGRGVTTYSGWNRDEMEEYLLRSVGPDDHARQVAARIVSAAQALDLYEFHDDTTVIVLRLRERLSVNLLVDPAEHTQREDQSVMLTDSALQEINASVRGERELQKLVDQLERYLGNGMMSLGIKGEADSVSELIDLLAEQASDVNILFCTDDSVIPETVLRLRQLLADAGKTVTLRVY